ncbi:hypothetical protein Anas_04216 [Armadillidium nasatum]|uniref:Transmembrane protein 138 n=1 Tax=Armadillidium nasatum TaxID=96803 RepID=A0A5N5SVT3_9CRUS|nr:hypothetical protein Anas_04216 [Armadillidium nasatum]
MNLLEGSVLRYKFLSLSVLSLLLFDLICNSTFVLFSHNNLVTLLIYIMQNTFLLFTFILISFGIFSTSLAKVGFIGKLLRKFKWTITISILYFCLSLSFPLVEFEQKMET